MTPVEQTVAVVIIGAPMSLLLMALAAYGVLFLQGQQRWSRDLADLAASEPGLRLEAGTVVGEIDGVSIKIARILTTPGDRPYLGDHTQVRGVITLRDLSGRRYSSPSDMPEVDATTRELLEWARRYGWRHAEGVWRLSWVLTDADRSDLDAALQEGLELCRALRF